MNIWFLVPIVYLVCVGFLALLIKFSWRKEEKLPLMKTITLAFIGFNYMLFLPFRSTEDDDAS